MEAQHECVAKYHISDILEFNKSDRLRKHRTEYLLNGLG